MRKLTKYEKDMRAIKRFVEKQRITQRTMGRLEIAELIKDSMQRGYDRGWKAGRDWMIDQLKNSPALRGAK